MPVITTVQLYVTACPRCGVMFGITDIHEQHLRKSGQNFYCPNRHRMRFGLPAKAAKADILAIHEREQAEARAAEEQSKKRGRRKAA